MTIRTNDYWEHEEKERAALTHDEVVRLLDFELMRKGVLSVEPLTLAEVPEPKLPTMPYYRIRSGHHQAIGLAFALEAQARMVIDAQPYLIKHEYIGESIDCVTSATEFVIECIELPALLTVEAAKIALKEAAAAKSENDRRTRAHADQSKAVESATRGLWEDWHACRATAEKMAKVESTFAKYVSLVGGPEGSQSTVALAQKFLRQVFTVAELTAAEEWTGRDFGSKLDFGDVKPAAAPAVEAQAF
jgi:hypothetical protein